MAKIARFKQAGFFGELRHKTDALWWLAASTME
jgi:hypothetical protein